MNQIYNCFLYKLILKQRQKMESLIQQNNILFLDFILLDFSKSEKLKKCMNQKKINEKEINKINEEMIKFKHCEKCLLKEETDE